MVHGRVVVLMVLLNGVECIAFGIELRRILYNFLDKYLACCFPKPGDYDEKEVPELEAVVDVDAGPKESSAMANPAPADPAPEVADSPVVEDTDAPVADGGDAPAVDGGDAPVVEDTDAPIAEGLEVEQEQIEEQEEGAENENAVADASSQAKKAKMLNQMENMNSKLDGIINELNDMQQSSEKSN